MTPFQLRRAARCIQHGGIVAYPTEAVWGLGCDPWNADACYRLLQLKNRPFEKGLILVAADQSQIEPLINRLTAEQQARLSQKLNQATTWVMPASTEAPAWITGGRKSIAIRITQHPVAKALCEQVGYPIVSTSANLSGLKPAITARQIRHSMGGFVDCYLPGVTGAANNPSQIRDISSNEILRQ